MGREEIEPAINKPSNHRPAAAKVIESDACYDGGFTKDTGNAAIESGLADFVVFGKLFTSNPDLPVRFARDAALGNWDASTFYPPGPKGYTDFAPLSV